ncbi:hypothetical protein DSO57_1000718 [Entomophthora muscae]|uniref:Uncharacterized protein n=1 Tax=Entomophthora muscae TaxID=34485 RepID=A0ACC2SM37_9FUNG|nr:hypothetical protein DSO57_1000718 [Entomophthora muscae]
MSFHTFLGAAGAVAAVGTHVVKSGEFHPWMYRLFGIAKPAYPVSGHVEPDFKDVENVFAEHFGAGREVGASVAVFANGNRVVELYGGYADYEKGVVYSKDTLQLVFSSSKVLESIALARLVGQGLLRYDDTVASIWPEFGVGEKGGVTVAQVMRHEAGLPYISGPKPSLDDLMARETLASLLARQEHLYKGKRVRCYHVMTRGWILNEIIQRVDIFGRSLGQIYQQEFNSIPGVEFYLGLSEENKHRRAKWYNYPLVDVAISASLPQSLSGPRILSDVPIEAFKPNTPISKAVSNMFDSLDVGNKKFLAEFEIPSSNGFTSAISLATLGAHLANGGSLNGNTLIPNTCLHMAIDDPVKEYDACLYIDTIMTQAGFGIYVLDELALDTKFYGWAGMGGSAFVFNLEFNFSFAYTMNAAHSTLTLSGRARTLLISAFKAHIATIKKKINS